MKQLQMSNELANYLFLTAFCFLFFITAQAVSANEQQCKQCHNDIVQKWSVSHHAKSMQVANDKTILGDFNNKTISHHGQTASFTKIDNRFQVTMKDEGHAAQTYIIAYSFGITPLQQYLVETKDGQYQVLPFAWDARAKEDGGQLWFHIYPEEYLPPKDRLHWQQPLQNWNGMCADCHSTGLKRNYNPEKNLFNTRFDNVNISCRSCHVLNDDHAIKPAKKVDKIHSFILKDGQKTAKWSGDKPRNPVEMKICMACHSRREVLTDGISPAIDFLDQFSPSLLTDELYFSDGQINDEVYVWGSFLQSKMARNEVTCSDCHDSHSLKLKVVGNGLCTQCHVEDVFNTPSHHHHNKNGKGAECVSCHMPERTYMVVDKRRDHSFKIPRPDMSSRIGSPNACISCHDDHENSWATEAVNHWYPNSRHRGKEALIIHNARRADPTARTGLLKLIQDDTQSEITRATALSLIPRLANNALIQVASKMLRHKEPLIRMGAIRAMAVLSPGERLSLLSPLLQDTVKAVRVEAARQLLDAPGARIIEQAFSELSEANRQASWRGEGRVNMALSHEFSGETSKAEKQYREALKIDPAFSAALINLSDLLRRTGRDKEAVTLLQNAIGKKGNLSPALYHTFGLALVRSQKLQQGIDQLKQAVTLDPNNARYTYVYLVALNSYGKPELAYSGLKSALKEHPYNMDLLNFALSLALNKRENIYARTLLRKMLKIDPMNRQYKQILSQLN